MTHKEAHNLLRILKASSKLGCPGTYCETLYICSCSWPNLQTMCEGSILCNTERKSQRPPSSDDTSFDKALDKELHRVRQNREGLQTLSSKGELDYHLMLSNGILYMQQLEGHNTRWWNDLPAVIMRFSRWCQAWSDLMQSCRCAPDIKCDMENHGLQWDHGICFVFLPASMHNSIMQELPQGACSLFPKISTVITTGAMIDNIVRTVKEDRLMKKHQVYLQKLIAIQRWKNKRNLTLSIRRYPHYL